MSVESCIVLANPLTYSGSEYKIKLVLVLWITIE